MKSLGDNVSYNKERDEYYYKFEGINISLSDLRIMLSVIEAIKSEKVNEVNRELHSNI